MCPNYFVFSVLGAVFVSVWGSIWTLILFSVWAGYYWVVGKILGVKSDWRNWFGFTCWTAVPTVLGSLFGMVLFKLATTELAEIFRPYPFFLVVWNDGSQCLLDPDSVNLDVLHRCQWSQELDWKKHWDLRASRLDSRCCVGCGTNEQY